MANTAPENSDTPQVPFGHGFESWELPDGFDTFDLASSLPEIDALEPQTPVKVPEEGATAQAPIEPPKEPGPAVLSTQTSLPDAEKPPNARLLVEAVLFLGGPPRPDSSLAEALPSVNPAEITRCIQQLNETYQAQNRPYRIVRQERGWQMLLRPAHRLVAERLRGEAPTLKLEGLLLETLAVVAYRQPIKRADIDALRGSDSSGSLRQLARMGLILGEGSRETTYRTTPAFLKLFSIDRLEDLPRPVDLEKQ